MKYQSILYSLVIVSASACTSGTDSTTTGDVSKDELVLGGKADTAAIDKVCTAIGFGPGCDLCDIAGWYGDGVCDSFCKQYDARDCGPTCLALPVCYSGESEFDSEVECASSNHTDCREVSLCGSTIWCGTPWVEREPDRTCQVDADCKLANLGCCGYANDAVNVNYDVWANQPPHCAYIACAQALNYPQLEARCEQGTCAAAQPFNECTSGGGVTDPGECWYSIDPSISECPWGYSAVAMSCGVDSDATCCRDPNTIP